MHLTKIEEYNFTHGLHFNNQTGEYYSLNPHTLGRALTHEEMDYNLIYQKQTLNGFRIAGSATDLTLTANDLGFTLVYAQISTGDADWNRYQTAGLFDGQFVWVPKALATTTTTTTLAPSYDTFTASAANVNEGDTVSFNLTTTNIADGTTVGYTINGVSGADINGAALTGNLTVSGNQATLVLAVSADTLTEGAETITVTLDAADENGVTAGLSASSAINDTSLTNFTISYEINTNTSNLTGQWPQTDTAVDGSTYTLLGPTFSATNGWVFKEWSPFADGSTAQYDPGDTLVIGGNVTLYAIWTQPSYTALTATPQTTNEGANVTINLTGADVPNGRTVGWTITGVSNLDVSGSLSGTFTMNGDAASYLIGINADNLTEGTETLTFTCDATDNAGTANGLSTAITINDTSTDVLTYSLANNGPKNEGANLVWTLTTSNVPDGTTVPFTLSGSAQAGVDYSNNTPLEFDVQNNTATYLVTVFADNLTEGQEDVGITLGATDSGGNATGGISSSTTINDTSLDPTYTIETLFNHNAPTTNHEMQTPLGTDVGTSHTITNSGLAAGATMSHTVFLVADAGWEFDYSSLNILLGGSPIDLANQPAGVTITQQSATQIRIQRDYVNIQANANSTMNISTVPMLQVFDCNYAGLTINISNGNVGNAVNYSVSIDGNAAANTSISPATYQNGTTNYNVTFDIPAGFANSGQETCQASGVGTLPTQSMYWIHWGNGAFPYAQDLEGSGPFYYEANGGVGGPGVGEESSIQPILQNMIDNPSQWTVFVPGDSQTTMQVGDSFSFPTATAGSFYYLVIPDSYGIPDLTQVNKISENGGPAGAAASKLSLTLNGNPYTMYKLTASASTATLTAQYV